MALVFKFAYVFAGLGFLVSFLFGLLGGVRFSSVLFTSLVSTLISGGLGAGIHSVLVQKVPESLKLFQLSLEDPDTRSEEIALPIKDKEQETKDEADAFALETQASSSTSSSPSASSALSHSGAEGAYGTHIMVEKIKIKNEPKLLAEAVRTMIARDDGGAA